MIAVRQRSRPRLRAQSETGDTSDNDEAALLAAIAEAGLKS